MKHNFVPSPAKVLICLLSAFVAASLLFCSTAGANESVEKVSFLKSTLSAGSKTRNYHLLSSKVFTILGTMFLFS
jgi:hypothetical protein